MLRENSANLPENLPPWLHWLETCASTNTWAMSRIKTLKHGDVVFTRQQTAGRGQRDRIWVAPPGVLTASFVLDSIPGSQLPGLSLAAGLAVIYTVEDLLPNLRDTLHLKWPNDIWIEQRKLAGILCEAATDGKGRGGVVVGIGLNHRANFSQSELDARAIANAISLHQVSNYVPDELSLLGQLRHYLLQASAILSRSDRPLKSSGLTSLLPELRRRDGLRDRLITLELPEGKISGQASGIDASGHLLVRLPNGQVQAFASGRVLW
jgi:BirA family transcriptional regulator, biotin operon repressor / biotin---[acetyl-CoA-carboxylase] ligase